MSHLGADDFPERFADVAALEAFMTGLNRALFDDLVRTNGDVLVPGFGGIVIDMMCRRRDVLVNRFRPVSDNQDYGNAVKVQRELLIPHLVDGDPCPWNLREAANGMQLAEAAGCDGLREFEVFSAISADESDAVANAITSGKRAKKGRRRHFWG
jgi:hypothetical protein